MELCKKLGYPKLCISGTYTKLHEDAGYSYMDVRDFLTRENVRVTLNRVMTNNESLCVQSGISSEQMREDIKNSLRCILNNNEAAAINHYVYNFLLSLICNARTETFCDDLVATNSVTYDYNGDKYNCFRLWNDKKFVLSDGEVNREVQEINDKSHYKQCSKCWAKYMCKICIIAVMQNVSKSPVDDMRCVDQEAFEIVLEEIIKIVQNNEQDLLVQNFLDNFLFYEI